MLKRPCCNSHMVEDTIQNNTNKLDHSYFEDSIHTFTHEISENIGCIYKEDTFVAREVCRRQNADSFFGYDEYPFDPSNEQSAFSVTTTSTSNYIDVECPVASSTRPLTPDSAAWSPLYGSDPDPLNVSIKRQPCSQSCQRTSTKGGRRRNKLSKLRSYTAPPASPAEVLARDSYNHSWVSKDEKPLLQSPRTELPRLARVLSKRFLKQHKRGGDEDRWVCVDVEHKVTQYDLIDDM